MRIATFSNIAYNESAWKQYNCVEIQEYLQCIKSIKATQHIKCKYSRINNKYLFNNNKLSLSSNTGLGALNWLRGLFSMSGCCSLLDLKQNKLLTYMYLIAQNINLVCRNEGKIETQKSIHLIGLLLGRSLLCLLDGLLLLLLGKFNPLLLLAQNSLDRHSSDSTDDLSLVLIGLFDKLLLDGRLENSLETKQKHSL